MNRTTKFVGLDVAKDEIVVGVADVGREPARYYGKIPHTIEAARKLVHRLGGPEGLMVCYEAGPTGYGLYRALTEMGVQCVVVAPSLTPGKPGDRVKTDRRDALRLAQLLRAGELTPVWVPSESDKALRDLTRAREDAKQDLLRARHRLSKFLLRHGLVVPAGVRSWSAKHRKWLDSLKFELPALRITFQEYLHAIDEIHVIQALQALRGVAEVTATTLVAEIGQFSRFRSPSQLMAMAGLVPSEYSSGARRRQGAITKTGNAHVRRVMVEAAWHYRHPAALKGALRKRQEGLDPTVQAIACRKYSRLLFKGKSGAVAATAVARELLSFVWAIACQVESGRSNLRASLAA